MIKDPKKLDSEFKFFLEESLSLNIKNIRI